MAMLNCVEELRILEAGEPTTEFTNIDFLRVCPFWLKALSQNGVA